MIVNNKYTNMQKSFYEKQAPNMARGNHSEHDNNENYWNIILGDVKEDPSKWSGKKALDFGCGCGRNVYNITTLANWRRVDGCDISSQNIEYSKQFLSKKNVLDKCKLYVNDGVSLDVLETNEYDFIMSTIVFQHICVYDIRKSLLKEIYRCLNNDGLFSLQMGYGEGHPVTRDYYDNHYDAGGTNSSCDVRIDDQEQLVKDFEEIGFVVKDIKITPSHSDRHGQ
jgi:ubiquinone/menaquinone biosynthesis C-methylase UbiE